MRKTTYVPNNIQAHNATNKATANQAILAQLHRVLEAAKQVQETVHFGDMFAVKNITKFINMATHAINMAENIQTNAQTPKHQRSISKTQPLDIQKTKDEVVQYAEQYLKDSIGNIPEQKDKQAEQALQKLSTAIEELSNSRQKHIKTPETNTLPRRTLFRTKHINNERRLQKTPQKQRQKSKSMSSLERYWHNQGARMVPQEPQLTIQMSKKSIAFRIGLILIVLIAIIALLKIGYNKFLDNQSYPDLD